MSTLASFILGGCLVLGLLDFFAFLVRLARAPVVTSPQALRPGAADVAEKNAAWLSSCCVAVAALLWGCTPDPAYSYEPLVAALTGGFAAFVLVVALVLALRLAGRTALLRRLLSSRGRP